MWSAIVLAKRNQDAAPLSFAFAAVALQPLDLVQVTIEVGALLLNLIAERAALRRLAAEQRKESTALAAQALRLLDQPVELGLLLAGGILVAPDLLGCGRVEVATIDRGELALEPHAVLRARGHRIALRGGRNAILGGCRHGP